MVRKEINCTAWKKRGCGAYGLWRKHDRDKLDLTHSSKYTGEKTTSTRNQGKEGPQKQQVLGRGRTKSGVRRRRIVSIRRAGAFLRGHKEIGIRRDPR